MPNSKKTSKKTAAKAAATPPSALTKRFAWLFDQVDEASIQDMYERTPARLGGSRDNLPEGTYVVSILPLETDEEVEKCVGTFNDKNGDAVPWLRIPFKIETAMNDENEDLEGSDSYSLFFTLREFKDTDGEMICIDAGKMKGLVENLTEEESLNDPMGDFTTLVTDCVGEDYAFEIQSAPKQDKKTGKEFERIYINGKVRTVEE